MRPYLSDDISINSSDRMVDGFHIVFEAPIEIEGRTLRQFSEHQMLRAQCERWFRYMSMIAFVNTGVGART